jgi:hypothetical protein
MLVPDNRTSELTSRGGVIVPLMPPNPAFAELVLTLVSIILIYVKVECDLMHESYKKIYVSKNTC